MIEFRLPMNYQQALDYIYSFVDYGLKSRYKYSPETFDLTRMRNLLARLGDPQLRTPAVHVAGTKGKGSVSAMTASILRAAGYAVGLYTSPHLNDFCERIQLDGQPIAQESLAGLVSELKPIFDSTDGVTTFEIATALAHVWFAQAGAQFAVLEVGLGGRLDATNVLLPNVCAITSISLDHIQLLGNTLAEIAEEKAGIIKGGVPVVCAPQAEEALHRIEAIARERGSALRVAGRDRQFGRESFDSRGQRFWSRRGDAPIEQYDMPLLGMHQVENAVVALTIVDRLREQGFAVPSPAVQLGFRHVIWHGRFEILRGQKIIVLDCAHNRDSARRLVTTMQEVFPDQRPALLFGSSDDKDTAGMLQELLPHVARVVFAKANHPRASDPSLLLQMANTSGVALSAIVPDTLPQAIAEVLRGDEPYVLITGSIFLVADARAEITLLTAP